MDHLKGLRHVMQDYPRIERRIVVCLEPKARTLADGIDILPARTVAGHLAEGSVF